MPASHEIEGVKEAIRALRKIDPEMRKTFNANVKEIASPMIDAIKTAYTDSDFPSGTAYNWTKDGRQIFPLTVGKAKRGAKVKIDTSRKSTSAITVMQTNRAAAVFDKAGAANPANKLARAMTAKSNRNASRVMWPIAENHIEDVRANLIVLIEEVEKTISDELEK